MPSTPQHRPFGTSGAAASRPRRDAAASRARILAAATTAFAHDGYEGTAMARVAADAGVSSALPAYFFGDKHGLYAAVLQAQYDLREDLLQPLARRIDAYGREQGVLTGLGLRLAVGLIVTGYVGFLESQPEFVRLMGWEALNEGRRPGLVTPPHSAAVREALDHIIDRLDARRPWTRARRDQVLVTTIALCFFPDAHADTMLAGLGLDPHDPAWRRKRLAHIVDVLAAALEAG